MIIFNKDALERGNAHDRVVFSLEYGIAHNHVVSSLLIRKEILQLEISTKYFISHNFSKAVLGNPKSIDHVP